MRGLVALGNDLLSHLLQAVPSARPVLTSLFGMGRGVPRRYRHRNLSARPAAAYGLTSGAEGVPRSTKRFLFFFRAVEQVSGD